MDELVGAELQRELPVLREAPLRHVDAREHLDAGGERRPQIERELALADHDAVDPVAHPDGVALGLDVDVAGAHGDGAAHQVVEHLDGIEIFVGAENGTSHGPPW